MRNVIRVVDSVNKWVGLSVRWLVVALVVVIAYDVIARYVFNAPTVWGYQTVCILGGAFAVLGWGYAHLHHAHGRVDVLYIHLSPRGKAMVDVLAAVVLFFPLFACFIITSISQMWKAWLSSEVMVETFWYPPAAPFRTVVMIGGCLLFLQFLAQFLRDLYTLRKDKSYD